MRYYLLAKKLSEEDRREHQHLEAAALEHLLAADRTAKQTEQLFHVLAVCPHCREVGGWLLELHQANALPPVFGLIDAALARSRAEAHQLWQELVSLDPEARLSHLQADSRFVSWGLCELLVHESRRAAPESASEAVHLADLAVHVADRIAEGEPFEEKWIYQCAASPGPPSAMPTRCRWISREPRGASRCRTHDRNPFEAALATLDLVVSHLEEGHTAEVRLLADERVAVFRAHDVPREALAAVLLFHEAAHREAATAELAREVAASISRARRGAPPLS